MYLRQIQQADNILQKCFLVLFAVYDIALTEHWTDPDINLDQSSSRSITAMRASK